MLQYLDKLIPNKILAIFRVGSKVYGLDNGESDEDYIVIVDKFDAANVLKQEGYDFFILGDSYFEKLCNLDKGTLSYFAVWIDEVLIAKKNLVYIDETYKKRFDLIINVDWKQHFKSWLARVVEYFALRIEHTNNPKPLYHLIRIKSQVEYFIQSGIFEYRFSDEDRQTALRYKNQPEQYADDVISAFNYIKHVFEEVLL